MIVHADTKSVEDVLEAALHRLYRVRPVWSKVISAHEAVNLEPMTLLHAGPPFADPRHPSAPVMSSAVLCCLYEGWASTEAEAQQLISDGRVSLRPGQDYRVVTPLAGVISPSSSLVEVSDAASQGKSRCWSLLGSGAGPQLRFGSRDPEILRRMAWRDQQLAPVLRDRLAQSPIDLVPIAAAGLLAGDDLHSCTTAATAQLSRELSAGDESVNHMLQSTPLFFLTLWMAACHLMLDATVSAGSADKLRLVVAMAGNGIDAGVRLSNAPDQWITTPAHVPQGIRSSDTELVTSPMVGDSGVIDAAGFGAQAWFYSRSVANEFAGWLPKQPSERSPWLVGSHPAFSAFGLGCAVNAAAISHASTTPMIAIAMLDAAGEQGLLGRGVCLTDPSLFGLAPESNCSVNEPRILAELNHAFDRYERALVSNDITVLDELFWESPHVLRYGAKEQLYGYRDIQAFRKARPGNNLNRTIVERSITTFGSEYGVANIVFTREGESRLGRQTQSWVRADGNWRIVAAHVSWVDV